MPYRVDLETGLIDYDMLEKNLTYRPKVLVAVMLIVVSDYKRMRDC